jgi:hypothetical protein
MNIGGNINTQLGALWKLKGHASKEREAYW